MLHVVVVGGGPAGLIAAAAMAGAGIRVTLVERAPDRMTPCTGLVASPFMQEFQVPELLLSQRVAEVALSSPTQRPAFLNASNNERWSGSMRRELLQALFKRRAEEAGVTFLRGTFMRFTHSEGDYPQLQIKLPAGGTESLQADVVLGADGVHSRVARQLGLPALPLGVTYQERLANAKPGDTLHLHFGRKVSADTYGWLLPQGDQVVLGVSTATKYGRRVWDMLAELKRRLGSQLEGTRSLGREAFCYPLRPRPKLAYERVLLVGDAAGLVAPAVHDGLYYACRSGLLAAETIIRHQHVPLPERLAEYEKLWKLEFDPLFAAYAKLEESFFANDRQRETLIDLAWDREAQRLAMEAFLTKKRFAPPLGLKLKLRTRQVSKMVKYRVIDPKRLEQDLVARNMKPPRNYLDLALETTIPEETMPSQPQHQEI